MLVAAERAGVELPQPQQKQESDPLAEPGERFARRERANMRDSPLSELFRPTS